MPEYTQSEAIKAQAGTGEVKLAEARKRLPLNLLSNMSWLVLNIFVGLWYTPYLIKHLGVAIYGLVPLVTSITNYLALLTDGFNSAVSRFLQIELARDDTPAANRIFNTSFAGALIIFALLLPIALLVSWLAPQILDVPSGHESDAQWLVMLTMLAFGTTFLSSSFAVSSFASHRFDLRLGVNIVRLSVQISCVVLFFTLLSPRVWQVGVGIYLSALFFFLGHHALWRRLTPQLKIRLDQLDLSRLKQMGQFSGWVMVNQAGAQLFLNIDLLVANVVFGAHTAGRYGAVILFPSLMRTMVGTINGVLAPIVFALYAQNNLPKLTRFCQLSVKYMGFAIALPIGLICGLAKPLLTIWLGPEYADLSWLVVMLVGHLSVNLAVQPLFSIQVSTNHVRLPGILTLIMGITNAALAVALALWSGWGFISIAIAGAIVLTTKNAIFTPLYNARILHLPWWTFLPNLVISTTACLLVFSAGYWITLNFTLASWFQIAYACVIIGAFYLIAVYYLGVGASDRSLIISEIRQRIVK